MMRPLAPSDFQSWSEVRASNCDWLTVWEPSRHPRQPDPTSDKSAFASRCLQCDRDRDAGLAYQFGMFLHDRVIGEINLNNIVRGAMQTCTIGYWIDRRHAGRGYTAEGVVMIFRFLFEQLGLHRAEICIVPRNHRSRRVMEKLNIREEGLAERYLEINGVWEDHIRYGFTVEEWQQRRPELIGHWIAA